MIEFHILIEVGSPRIVLGRFKPDGADAAPLDELTFKRLSVRLNEFRRLEFTHLSIPRSPRMNIHKNAHLTPLRRRKWPLRNFSRYDGNRRLPVLRMKFNV
jgi:hypothetical protein